MLRSLLCGLLLTGLSISAFAQSDYFPTYHPGPLGNGEWVLGSGQIITPAGTQVNLMVKESTGTGVRAKVIALNPNLNSNGHRTAAVLTLGSNVNSGAIQVLDVTAGTILQVFTPNGSNKGATAGLVYTQDGSHLLFSQDSSYVTVANVAADGTLTYSTQVKLPVNLSFIQCFSNSPPGTTGSAPIPCGQTVSSGTAYPLGLAVTSDSKTAYSVLDTNDSLTKIDLTTVPPTQVAEIRVGNIPNSVLISNDGRTAYVSNEGGRIATMDDFQQYSNGTPIVSDNPTGTTSTATISVVDLASFTLSNTITLSGTHPTGMAFWGQYLLVADTYTDNISVIDTTTNKEVRKISVALPIGVPTPLASSPRAYGAAPNSLAVDSVNNVAYVALYNANAVAVVDLSAGNNAPVKGMIPVGYAPSSVSLDTPDKTLIVANDKGIGTANTNIGTDCSKQYNVCGFNSHQDAGTVSIVPIPDSATLAQDTQQVFQNNHWDLALNIASSTGGNPNTPPVAIPAKIGDPSLIKHVFVIIRENRTYDQILGDVAAGNGDASLAVFGGIYTPNAHSLVQRFPLLDNFYDPSRQSADGHNWIVQAMAPYSDDIQSPDWVRDYPSNGGEGLAYQTKGNLYDTAVKAGVKLKNYGEYIEYNLFNPPDMSHQEPTWCQFYADTVKFESQQEQQLYYYNTVSSYSALPNVLNTTVQNYPQFDTGIPDQFRYDIWYQDFDNDVANNNVPQLSFMWISSDHTGGPPNAMAMQADNDLALGRFIDHITHSPIWATSAIFVEEDDAQNGVDHVDGHRSPGYVVSPYVIQGGPTEHTFYTQVNMTRTIEQILGITPMNQFDLWASPMRTIFTDNPPQDNFKSWDHVPAEYDLSTGANCSSAPSVQTASTKESPAVAAMRAAWLQKKAEIFAGNQHKPDVEDPDTVAHYNWYEATGFTRPYPGEKAVRPPSEFNNSAPVAKDSDGD